MIWGPFGVEKRAKWMEKSKESANGRSEDGFMGAPSRMRSPLKELCDAFVADDDILDAF